MSFIAAVESGFQQVKDKEKNYFKLGAGVVVLKELNSGETADGVPFVSFRFKTESSDTPAHYAGEIVTKTLLLDSPGWKNRVRLEECAQVMEVLQPGFKRLDPGSQAQAIVQASDSKIYEGTALSFVGTQKIGKKTKAPVVDKKGEPIVDVQMTILPQTDAEKAARLEWLGGEE